jgi:hypothetical protein
MDLSTLFQLIPYASRLAAAAQTVERLEKDPGVQDILKLIEEVGPILAKASKPLQTG